MVSPPHPPRASLFLLPTLPRRPLFLPCASIRSLLACVFFSFSSLKQAGRLTVGAQKRVGHKDKRNLYLADEGLVLEDSGAAEGAAKSDMEKRVLARKDKKSKLKNPIFFVSPTRLSVRNLGRHVTDGKLKSMAAAAARAGVQAGRANPQDVRRYLEAQVRRRAVWCGYPPSPPPPPPPCSLCSVGQALPSVFSLCSPRGERGVGALFFCFLSVSLARIAVRCGVGYARHHPQVLEGGGRHVSQFPAPLNHRMCVHIEETCDFCWCLPVWCASSDLADTRLEMFHFVPCLVV